MLIALALAILAIFLGGDSPFVIPKLDNYVKTHVVDDGRKTIVLEYLKDAKAKRKAKVKQTNKEIKKLDHLFNSRETTREEMNTAFAKIIETQAESQKANIRVNQEAQKNITAEEWNTIMLDIGDGLVKTNKKISKMNTKISKIYTNWEAKIGKTIADKKKREKALASARNLKAIYLKNRSIVQDELMNKKSIMYQYNIPEDELATLQNKFIELTEEVLQAVITTHFELMELTTEEEWKKIL
jgi:hypothetical protein